MNESADKNKNALEFPTLAVQIHLWRLVGKGKSFTEYYPQYAGIAKYEAIT